MLVFSNAHQVIQVSGKVKVVKALPTAGIAGQGNDFIANLAMELIDEVCFFGVCWPVIVS